ncbi:MAG: tRNA pseudouridine(38-40) synthase TruA [Alphaproteobacteria bacterium]
MKDEKPPVIDADAVEMTPDGSAVVQNGSAVKENVSAVKENSTASTDAEASKDNLPAIAEDRAAKTQRWKLTIEYDGTDFAGWQRQDHLPTVQGSIEDAIYKFTGERVTVHVAGRTDAGVHALGQVAHIDLLRKTDEKTVRDAINFHLRPLAVSVLSAEAVSSDFHARFSATWRVYAYRILCSRRAPPALGSNNVWHHPRDLDLGAMNKAASYLTGTHDFTTFRATACQAKSPIRTLERLEFIEDKTSPLHGRHLVLWAEARSFLHHQIRNFAGTLAMVGEGKWQPEDVRAALEALDRTKGGPMAPASGLHLVRVDYTPRAIFQQGLDSML